MKSVFLFGDLKKGNHGVGPRWLFYSKTFCIKIMQINQEMSSITIPKDEKNYSLDVSI